MIDAAARLLGEHGPDALTTRRVAAEVGTSTMAVYTYFSGMEDLKRAVAVEGFARLARHLDDVERTGDTVADVAALGGAYFVNAVANFHLYRFMFMEQLVEDDPDVGQGTFERLIEAIARAIDAGRFAPAEPERLATQLWSAAHGTVTLHKAGLLTFEDALECFTEMGANLFVAFGDKRSATRRSLEKARRRILERPAGPLRASARFIEETSGAQLLPAEAESAS